MRVIICLVFGLIVVFSAGCGTVNLPQGGVFPGAVYGDGVYPSMKDSHTKYEFDAKDVEVLGAVTGEGESFNVLLLFSQGDNGYQQLLKNAKKKYPKMDALINFYWDTKYFNFGVPWPIPLPVYQRARSEVTAIAIRYKKR